MRNIKDGRNRCKLISHDSIHPKSYQEGSLSQYSQYQTHYDIYDIFSCTASAGIFSCDRFDVVIHVFDCCIDSNVRTQRWCQEYNDLLSCYPRRQAQKGRCRESRPGVSIQAVPRIYPLPTVLPSLPPRAEAMSHLQGVADIGQRL